MPLDISNSCDNIANYSIKHLSDFASSGRLDAEYYLSKYDEIENAIKVLSHKTLDEVADIQDSNFNPKANVVYKYIELANIGSSGEFTGCTEDLGENSQDSLEIHDIGFLEIPLYLNSSC